MRAVFSAIWDFIVLIFYTNASISIPIIISLVAIGISIATAKKENKIALFELRYKSYAQLKTISSFDASIYDAHDSSIILKIFDALWGTNIADLADEEKLIKERCEMEKIIRDVHQIKFLFKHKFVVDFSRVLQNMQHLLSSATVGKIDLEAQKELHRLCELFEDKDLNYICKNLRI